jgi:hypothetical protein
VLNNAAGSVQLEWLSLQDAIARSDPSTAAAAAAAASAGSFRWFGHRHCVGCIAVLSLACSAVFVQNFGFLWSVVGQNLVFAV